jgi:hypothetical protein
MRNTPQFVLLGLLLATHCASTGLRGAPGLPAAHDLPPLPAEPRNKLVRTQTEGLTPGRPIDFFIIRENCKGLFTDRRVYDFIAESLKRSRRPGTDSPVSTP